MTAFTPAVLESYSRFSDFLIGEEANQRVERRIVAASKQWQTNWLGRWNVAPLFAAQIFRSIYGTFAQAIGCFLYYAGLQRAGLWLNLHGTNARKNSSLQGYLKFGKDFLAPSINYYSTSSLNLYLMPRMNVEEIPCEEIQDAMNGALQKVPFDKSGGCCRGEMLWFIRAYLLTRDLFENARTHVQAIGSLFSYGADPQPALIQRLCLNEEVLQLQETPTLKLSNLGYDPKNRKPAYDAIISIFKDLEPGVYKIGVPAHDMAYICTEKGKGFLFDPDEGTVAISKQSGFQEIAVKITWYQTLKEGIEEMAHEAGHEHFKIDYLVKIEEVELC